MSISIELVKKLRDETGVSIMQCKKALEEVDGDMDKAKIILQKKSGAAAAKKSDRALGSGTIVTKKVGDKTFAVSLFCETDFVAKNDDFIKLANDILEDISTNGKNDEKITEMINLVVQKIGENIKLGDAYELEGNVYSYIHNGQIGAFVSLEKENEELGRDVAMHITAMKPEYLSEEEIKEEEKAKAKEIFQEEVENQGANKPQEIKDKMLQGKVDSFFKEKVLLNQTFIKDGNTTIDKLVSGSDNKIVKFLLISV